MMYTRTRFAIYLPKVIQLPRIHSNQTNHWWSGLLRWSLCSEFVLPVALAQQCLLYQLVSLVPGAFCSSPGKSTMIYCKVVPHYCVEMLYFLHFHKLSKCAKFQKDAQSLTGFWSNDKKSGLCFLRIFSRSWMASGCFLWTAASTVWCSSLKGAHILAPGNHKACMCLSLW